MKRLTEKHKERGAILIQQQMNTDKMKPQDIADMRNFHEDSAKRQDSVNASIMNRKAPDEYMYEQDKLRELQAHEFAMQMLRNKHESEMEQLRQAHDKDMRELRDDRVVGASVAPAFTPKSIIEKAAAQALDTVETDRINKALEDAAIADARDAASVSHSGGGYAYPGLSDYADPPTPEQEAKMQATCETRAMTPEEIIALEVRDAH